MNLGFRIYFNIFHTINLNLDNEHFILYGVIIQNGNESMNTMKKDNIQKHKIKKAIPADQNCFATHDGPSEGVGLHMYITEDGYVVGICKTKKCHQGYQDTIHGGIISTYFDEVLWYATTVNDERLLSMTAEMTVRYLSPLPTSEDIRIIANPMRRDGRHLYVDGYILKSDDEIAAEATAHFIVLRPEHEINDPDLYDEFQTIPDDMPEEVTF